MSDWKEFRGHHDFVIGDTDLCTEENSLDGETIQYKLTDGVLMFREKPTPKNNGCPFTHSHTKYWCGHDGCREG